MCGRTDDDGQQVITKAHSEPLAQVSYKFKTTRPRGYKTFSSTQLSMKFDLLIIFKFLAMSNSFLRNIAEHANKYENAND